MLGVRGPLRRLLRSGSFPGRGGPDPVSPGHFRTPQLLGLLRHLWPHHHLPQPGLLDLLVPGEPHCAVSAAAFQMSPPPAVPWREEGVEDAGFWTGFGGEGFIDGSEGPALSSIHTNVQEKIRDE